VLGSAAAPKGATIVDVQCPETVFLGDKIVMNVRLKATGLRGESLKVKLICDGAEVDQKSVEIAEDNCRPSVSRATRPRRPARARAASRSTIRRATCPRRATASSAACWSATGA
jgi:hypothetical protein